MRTLDLKAPTGGQPELDLNSAFILLGHLQAASVREQQENLRPHQPKLHDCGFTMAIDTPGGVVGVWSSWMRDALFIGYPNSHAPVSDDAICRTLGVSNVTGNSFRGPAPRGQSGELWIEHSQNSVASHEFRTVTEAGDVVSRFYGNGYGRNICTYDGIRGIAKTEGGIRNPDVVQSYRSKFFALAAEIAQSLGGARSVTTHFLDVLLPDQLEISGFTDVQWRKAASFMGLEPESIVSAKRGNEVVVLKRGNSSYPWTPLRRVAVESVTAELLDQQRRF